MWEMPEDHHRRQLYNDIKHDYNAVNAFLTVAIDHLKKLKSESQQDLQILWWLWAHYTSKGTISDVCYAVFDFGCPIHNSGSRHGKGASDGESAVIERHETTAVKVGRALIRNAKELYNYSTDNLTKEGSPDTCTHYLCTMFFIPSEDTERNTSHRSVKQVPGSTKLHCIKNNWVVATRNLSCFCDWLHGIGVCENICWAMEVKLHSLHGK